MMPVYKNYIYIGPQTPGRFHVGSTLKNNFDDLVGYVFNVEQSEVADIVTIYF